MRFDSDSAVFHGGVPFKIVIESPPSFKSYIISLEVMDESIKEYNDSLNKRSSVTRYIDGMRVDFLHMRRENYSFAILAAAVPDVESSIKCNEFTIKGWVVFDDNIDKKVDKIVIADIVCRNELLEV